MLKGVGGMCETNKVKFFVVSDSDSKKSSFGIRPRVKSTVENS